MAISDFSYTAKLVNSYRLDTLHEIVSSAKVTNQQQTQRCGRTGQISYRMRHRLKGSMMANGHVPSKLQARSPNPPWSRDAWGIGWQQVSSEARALPFKVLCSGSRCFQIYQQFERQWRRASERISIQMHLGKSILAKDFGTLLWLTKRTMIRCPGVHLEETNANTAEQKARPGENPRRMPRQSLWNLAVQHGNGGLRPLKLRVNP